MAAPTTRAAVPCATAEDVLRGSPRAVIDLRSPSEFAEDHIPGAINVPLFDDVERAVIGTLYRRDSAEAAFAEGRVRTLEKIGELTAGIARAAGWTPPADDLEQCVERMTDEGFEALAGGLEPRSGALPEDAVVLYCWRGGLRSRSVVAFLQRLGLTRAIAVEGGYKSYRKQVVSAIEGWSAPPTFVLRGLTGVGKTLVLRELEDLRPGWTVDLEGLAGHRSSILGMVGLEPCTQKTFDSRLRRRLTRGFPGPCVFEGESRKVGDVILPTAVWRPLDAGRNIELVAPTERRVQVLLDDYLAAPENRTGLRAQLPFIEERLGRRKWSGELVKLLDGGREAELVEVLLDRYYDPLYRHSEKERPYAETIEALDEREAAARVAEWIESRSD